MKKLIFGVLVLLLLVQFVTAATQIKVKTLPDHEVQLTVFDKSAEYFVSLERFRENTDEYGDITYTYTGDKSPFGIVIYVKNNNGETITNKKYDTAFPAGEPVYLELAPIGYDLVPTPGTTAATQDEDPPAEDPPADDPVEEPPADDPVDPPTDPEEEQQGTDPEQAKGNALTNLIVDNWVYIVIGVVVLVVLLGGVYMFLRFRSTPSYSKNVKVRKLSDYMRHTKLGETISKHDRDKMLNEAQKLINKAQEDIDKLRKFDEIQIIRDKMEKDQEKLERLQKGEDAHKKK